METTRNAFAYVFAGSGTFRDASNPQAVLTETAKPEAAPVYESEIIRWSYSTAAMKSTCRPVQKVFAFS